MWVHTGGPQKSLSSRDPELVQVLAHFAAPREAAAAFADLPLEQRQRRETLVGDLTRIGALVVATVLGDGRGPAPGSRQPVETHLAPLVDTIHRLAGEIAALGPYGLAKLDATGVPLETRITALLAGATALSGELAGLRAEYVGAQLARLGIDAQTRGLKLHLGAGPRRLPGWLNVDAHPAELAIDLRWGLPFADGAASHVFMSHTLEHFYYPDEAAVVLRDIHRVLASSGRLRLIVPDIEKCLHAYVEHDAAFFAARRRIWHWWSQQETRLDGFLAYAGAGPRPSQFLDSHKFGYDFETLERLLIRCGFTGVTRSEFQRSDDAVLRVDEASLVAGAQFGEASYSLFVEAEP